MLRLMRLLLLIAMMGTFSTLFLTDAMAQGRPAPAKGPPSLYFLSVGIEEYDTQSRVGYLYGAENSANLVADHLMDMGASFGLVLTSRNEDGLQGHAVTRGDVERAVYLLKKKIREENLSAPRILIYMMGHGAGDERSALNFMIPGNTRLRMDEFRQTNIFELPYRTIWNMDILSAAIAFRVHPSMSYLDDFFYSQTFPKGGMPWNMEPEQMKRAQELDREIRERRERGLYPSEGNPPVPYVVLFDNCYGEIDHDLGIDVPVSFQILMEGLYRNLVDEGLAFYAAAPGTNAQTTYVPERVRSTSQRKWGSIAGPLGVRLIDAMRDAGPGATLSSFQAHLQNGPMVYEDRVWVPYEQSGEIVEDTGVVRFLPDKAGRRGTLVRCFGSGRDDIELECH